MVSRWLVLSTVLVAGVCGQWGGAFLSEQRIQDERGYVGASGSGSNQNSMAGNNPFEGRSGPTGDSPNRNDASTEYKEKWLPTGRPGFHVPDDIKKMMDAAQQSKPTSRADFRGNTGFVNKMDLKTGTPRTDSDDDDTDDDSDYDDGDYLPKSAPGKSQEGRRMDKCLRKVAPYCSLRVMNENFAVFTACTFEMRYRIGDECREWAEGHGPCAPSITTYCSGMSPADTTECIKKNKSKLSQLCVDSMFYISMERGFGEFRKGMEEGMQGQPTGPSRYKGPQAPDTEEAPATKREPSKGPRAGADKVSGEPAQPRPTVVKRIVPKKVVHDPQDEL